MNVVGTRGRKEGRKEGSKEGGETGLARAITTFYPHAVLFVVVVFLLLLLSF